MNQLSTATFRRQEQRVTIARAIVFRPHVPTCDEPTGDLDRKSADEIMALIDELVGKYTKRF